MSHETFPNRAGSVHCPETDTVLAQELELADIPRLEQTKVCLFITNSNEVKTEVMDELHGWLFERYWYYWVVKGPGLPLDVAMKLWKEHGTSVRANGDCMCRSPYLWNNGFATTTYHIETQDGLNALAEVIRTVHKQAEDFVLEHYPEVLKEM
jgi:hypothetical protein